MQRYTCSTPVRRTGFLVVEQCSMNSRGLLLPGRLLFLHPILLLHLVLKVLGSVVEHVPPPSKLGAYVWLKVQQSRHAEVPAPQV